MHLDKLLKATGPWCAACWELSLLLQRCESERIGRMLIDGDNAWGDRMRGSERLGEEALGGFRIARLAEQKVDGLACGINGPVERIPLLFVFMDVSSTR
jgi:hypothetical protein